MPLRILTSCMCCSCCEDSRSIENLLAKVIHKSNVMQSLTLLKKK